MRRPESKMGLWRWSRAPFDNHIVCTCTKSIANQWFVTMNWSSYTSRRPRDSDYLLRYSTDKDGRTWMGCLWRRSGHAQRRPGNHCCCWNTVREYRSEHFWRNSRLWTARRHLGYKKFIKNWIEKMYSTNVRVFINNRIEKMYSTNARVFIKFVYTAGMYL